MRAFIKGTSSSNLAEDSRTASSACEIEAFLNYRDSDDEDFRGFDMVHPAALIDLNEDTAVQDSGKLMPQPKKVNAVATQATILATHWHQQHDHERLLARGNQGELHVFKHKSSEKQVVVKKMKTRSQHRLTDEAKVIKECVRPHPNIVQLFDVFFEPKPQASCNIVLEYCSGGDLFEFTKHWLSDRQEQIPEIFMLHFVASRGEALGYLHLGRRFDPKHDGVGMPRVIWDATHKPVLHRDMKLENILLRWSPDSQYGMPDIVLGDFDGAVLESNTSGGFGTNGYYAPEVIRYNAQHKVDPVIWMYHAEEPIMTQASDLYTFGACLCYMMLWGNYERGVYIEPAYRKSNLQRWPLLLILLEDCIAEDPQKRPSTETLFNWAAVLKLHVRALYQSGVRMPENSFPEQVDLEDVDGTESNGTASTSISDLEALINDANEYESQSFSSEDKICWCPNHGGDSPRRHRTECVPDMVANNLLRNMTESEAPLPHSAPGMASWI